MFAWRKFLCPKGVPPTIDTVVSRLNFPRDRRISFFVTGWSRTEEDEEGSRNSKFSVDLIVTSTARSFCVGFMRAKDKKSQFLLLEMPDVEKVGKAAVSQEFHFQLWRNLSTEEGTMTSFISQSSSWQSGLSKCRIRGSLTRKEAELKRNDESKN